MAIIGAASLAFKQTDKVASLDASTAANLNPESVNAFDRPVAYYSPANFASAQHISDVLLTVFVASPSLLLF